MAGKFYIEHQDVQTPSNGTAYFGPFDESEMTERLNDAYADLLSGGGNVEEVYLEDDEASKIYINPREFWMEQLALIERDNPSDIRTNVTEVPLERYPSYVGLCCRRWDLAIGFPPGRCGICGGVPVRISN